MLITNLLFFTISCAVLIVSGSFLIKSLSKIASFLKISEFVAAFILMAFATSVPELFVGISAALIKNPALILGTVIGSNIAVLTLIIGIAIIIGRGINIDSPNIKKDAMFMFFIALLPVVLMLINQSLSRIDGAILVSVFLFHLYRMYKKTKIFSKEMKGNIKRKEIVIAVFLFIASLVLLFYSAEFVVKYATLLSVDLALPSIIIGLFLVAIGTSLPELVFQSKAVLEGHSDMAMGDVIGAVVVNSTLVLGVSALIYPITAHFLLFLVSAVFMIVIAFLFATIMGITNRLSLNVGISFLLFYIFFVMVEFYIKTLGG
ncbi:MAG: sodium:calcium antiporter [Candidatus Aenigmarchaeota archaeon]|nr:sodium:calcium antiporter [Candidatus Aenigmarchaeota archaeon]